jgi:nucleoside-triphosphatase THEP1
MNQSNRFDVLERVMGCHTALLSAISQRHRNPMVKRWHVEDTSTVWQPPLEFKSMYWAALLRYRRSIASTMEILW